MGEMRNTYKISVEKH